MSRVGAHPARLVAAAIALDRGSSQAVFPARRAAARRIGPLLGGWGPCCDRARLALTRLGRSRYAAPPRPDSPPPPSTSPPCRRSWCPHCKSFAPQYEKVARALRARRAPVTVAKVDAAAHPALARRFGVLSFPSLRLIANGRVWAYPSDRSRSVASVVDFAQSAFKALPSEPVPPPATLLNQLQEELSAAAAAAVRLASSETQAVALIAASAFLGGMLVMLAITATVMCILPVPAPRAAPAPAQASIATSVARALGPAAAAQARHHSAAASPSVGPGAGGTVTPPVDGTITPMILEADLSEDEAPILGAAASPKPKARRRKGARKSK